MRMAVDSPLQILTAMITPAVLISASGTLALSTSSRLGRVIDRVRVLSDLFEGDAIANDHDSEAKRTMLLAQLEQLARRVVLLQTALTTLYTAISLFVGTSIAVAVLPLAGELYGWIAVTLGLVGASALFYGSIRLIKEARLAVASVLDEMTYIRGVAARHKRGYQG
jgi:Protein of unknown function (DUF2721)